MLYDLDMIISFMKDIFIKMKIIIKKNKQITRIFKKRGEEVEPVLTYVK